jgi:2C-methyl-D-erythritol 2,4-cyclodiphosphate synthase
MMAALLNEIINKRHTWLPDLIETEDAMRAWEAATPREFVLRLYKFLNQLGYTVVGIDAAIERERQKNKSASKNPDS